jgi:hypothetical protein
MDPGYPAPISNWGWGAFGADGIDAALWSGSKCYFFKGNEYIRVTRGETGAGTMDAGYPAPISNWNWGSFGANGIDAALYSGSKCYFFKGDQYIRVSRGDTGAGLLDANYPAPISNWNWGAFGANGVKGGLYSGGALVAPPAGGLVSNVNYFLEDGGAALTGVTATVNFDLDFVSTANAYSFQLNCYSTEGKNITTEWQQFVIYASPGDKQLYARIDTWRGIQATDELNRIDVALAKLPSTTIPAGTAFTMALTYDAANNVTGCVYTVSDRKGKVLGTTTIKIVGQTLRTTGKPATAANLAPIAAFQYNIGGDYGSSRSTLTSGSGTITYTANNALSVVNAEPSYTDFDDGTAENANLVFGPMPQAASAVISQSFEATTAGAQPGAPEEQRTTRRTHGLPAPDNLSLGRHVLPEPEHT